MRRIPVWCLCLAAIALGSCGGKKPQVGEERSAPSPVAVLVDQEVSGTILGYSLQRPWGLATDNVGTVYCVDGGNNRIIRFRRDLTPVRDAGGTGSSAGLLSQPSFVTIDNRLNVFVSDEGNQRVCRFNADLLFVDAIDFYDINDPLRFGTPSGVAVNQYGEMWVADRKRNQIAVYGSTGSFDRFIAQFGYQGGQVASPEKIVVTPDGKFAVCDAGNGRVAVYDQYGNFDYAVTNDAFNYPIAAAFSGDLIWVLDGADGRLFLCDRKGTIRFTVGPTFPGGGALKEPSDLVILPDNRLLIADTGNNRLLVCRIIRDEQ